MAFSATGLTLVAGSKAGNAPQVWAYTCDDSATTVDTEGYFNSVASLLKVGDLIYRVTTSAGAVSTAGWHVVLSNTGTVVDVSDTTALTVTDSR
jgi:hypothetical protein